MKFKKQYKQILIISDSFVPQKISAAGMMYNLSQELIKKKFNITCAFSGKLKKNIKNNYELNEINLISTNIFQSFRNKSLIFRFIFEISTAIILAIKCHFYFKNKQLDLIVWYGPSVFLWIVVKVVNFSKKAPVYYVLRDIFPDWLIFLKVVKNSFIIWLLNKLSNPQYTVSDIIGVETKENLDYLEKKIEDKTIEFLPNWPNIVIPKGNKIDEIIQVDFNKSVDLAGKRNIFKLVYTGNTSAAHDFDSLIKFFNKSFEFKKIQINLFSKSSKSKKVDNNLIKQNYWGLVQDYNLPFVFSKMDCGIVCLSRFAKTNNIPGKFVSYTQFGLPIICFANINSALSKLILSYNCGIVIDLKKSSKINIEHFIKFMNDFKKNRKTYSKNSKKLFVENFDTKSVADQILKAL